MAEKQETSADIIAEMRAYAKRCREKNFGVAPECEEHYNEDDVECLADRLEAATKREKTAIEADALAAGGIVEAGRHKSGDMAAMREALIDVVKRLEVCVGCDYHTFYPTATTCDGITSVGKCGKIATCAAIFKARAALSSQPRNCDVGTAEEQYARFDIWCGKQPKRYCKACAECPTQRYAVYCFCKWAQMPYEEGGAR